MRLPLRHVLCPTDFTAIGNGAVAIAFELAGPGSTVHVLTVCEPEDYRPFATGPWSPAYVPTAEERTRTEAAMRERLRALVPPGAKAEGILAELHVEHGFPVADRIEDAARRVNADVVVIGTHGRAGLERVLLGSVAKDVLERKGLSVVLVRADRADRNPAAPASSPRKGA